MSTFVDRTTSLRASVEVAARPSSPRRLAVAVALMVTLTSVFAYASPSRTFGWGNSSFSSTSEAELVVLTNRARASAGLRSLKVDSALTSVARWRSKDMITRDYFSHTIPGYGKVWDKLKAIGYCYKVAGENIGWNNYPDDVATAAIQTMFMNSAGHRANILGAAWDHIGVGAYKGPDGKKMWTVLFADKCGTSSSTPKPTAKPTSRPVSKATPKPTPKPTPRKVATPTPTPEPTPKTIEFLKPDPDATAPGGAVELLPQVGGSPPVPTDDGSIPTNDNPSQDPADETAGDGAVGMRVVDQGGTDGLLQSIVGGVTGLFLGG